MLSNGRNRDFILNRLKNFYNGEGYVGTKDNNFQMYLYQDVAPLTSLTTWAAPDLTRPLYEDAVNQNYTPTTVGSSFGPTWATHWFRCLITIPANFAGKEVHFIFDSGSEAMIYENDEPKQGITGGNNSDRRVHYILTRNASQGTNYTIYVEMACNHRQMDGNPEYPDNENLSFTLVTCEIRVFDREVYELMHDYIVLKDMAIELSPDNNVRGMAALQIANQMVNTIKWEDRSTYSAARALCADFLSRGNDDTQHRVFATGHCHIDSAWLWPFAEAKRKVARTFSTTCRLMEYYPEYLFSASAAQHYQWVKEDYPPLYEKMKLLIAEGRFKPIGGVWVEADMNLTGNEGLLRQFLYGMKFFQQEFGVICEEFWLPDTFGYAAQLPQIMKGFGLKYFLTTKLSWNSNNTFPHNTFYWVGLDGSQVLAHFPPGSIQADGGVRDTLSNLTNKNLSTSNSSMMLFGNGDGGGGPSDFQLEQLSRTKNLSALPVVQQASVKEFFDDLTVTVKPETPVWTGELYLELHRGTYTTQGLIKRYNRKLEYLLTSTEFLSSVSLALSSTFAYPSAELLRIWRLYLLNQFHDVLPGTIIDEAVKEAWGFYEDIQLSGTNLGRTALNFLLPPGNNIVSINTLGFDREEILEFEGSVFMAQAPSFGWQLNSMNKNKYGPVTASEKILPSTGKRVIYLSNDFVSITLSDSGDVVSCIDKRVGREVIKQPNVGNHFILCDDSPVDWSAWDMDHTIHSKQYQFLSAGTATIVEQGTYRTVVSVTKQVSANSTLTQRIILTILSARLEFHTSVVWNEKHKCLKVEFPVDIRSDFATYEIQYGQVSRPSYKNTSWDDAKFEVCAQKWMDKSEYDFGVALLNDCKYGHSNDDNVMRITLLRSPNYPDRDADVAQTHQFAYALFPHLGGNPGAGKVVREALSFNVPMMMTRTISNSSVSFFSVDKETIIIDCIKKAEESNDLIVRMYETAGGRCTATLSTGPLFVESVTLIDMYERPISSMKWMSGKVFDISFTPFQIVNVRITVDNSSTGIFNATAHQQTAQRK